jgi:hypothetical protein
MHQKPALSHEWGASGTSARPERSPVTGLRCPLEIFTSSLYRKDSSSLAIPKVSNEMERMQALKVTKAARDTPPASA